MDHRRCLHPLLFTLISPGLGLLTATVFALTGLVLYL